MKKLSANRILTGGERGGVVLSNSGDEIPCLHPFKVAANFFHFVQWLAQGRSRILPCWCRMKKLSANGFLTGGENRANHCPNSETRFVVSVALGSQQISCKVCRGRPPFPARVPAMPKIISIRPALRKSETPALKVFCEFHLDQGLIFEAAGFRQNGEMKCFDADGETGRWFSRQFSATSVWLKASATAKTKAFSNVIWKSSHGKSCALNAQCDFRTLIALLRMFNVIAHKYRPDARKRFSGHQPQNHFAAREMTVADFRSCETRGRRFCCQGGLPPVSRAVAVRSDRQPEQCFGRRLARLLHRLTPQFNDFPGLNRFRFLMNSIGYCGRKSKKTFCDVGTPVPVCLRVGFRFGGRINEPERKNTLFQNGTKPFENQLKSVLCLVP
jgi:hypothetical protein